MTISTPDDRPAECDPSPSCRDGGGRVGRAETVVGIMVVGANPGGSMVGAEEDRVVAAWRVVGSSTTIVAAVGAASGESSTPTVGVVCRAVALWVPDRHVIQSRSRL
ncbi:hypothetical protein QSJ19_24390 [Gordonia sp. ABSL11-1]|uniref:hypothetical protein n=1 Tax=Gordonia sp. ABSL11-1 TaxID=3053924 RepID=UPI00257288EC|nr:hypothetical protein [Gordonia sp. ABSL11-1]MDL9948667.1 hypothetical protein [Gordonia sp. ABSL11-1]